MRASPRRSVCAVPSTMRSSPSWYARAGRARATTAATTASAIATKRRGMPLALHDQDRLDCGQTDLEARALCDVHACDPAAVRFDERARGDEAETYTERFRRVEWLEEMRAD